MGTLASGNRRNFRPRSGSQAMSDAVEYVLAKLDWMERERIWPNGLRYLWTDAFDGYVSYRLLGEAALGSEIAEMRALIEAQYRSLAIDQDLGLGMMLWLAHFFPNEAWAKVQTERSIAALDRLWNDPPGFFSRSSREHDTRIAFANYGVALG